MKLKKFGFGQAKRLKIHYERSKEDDGLLKDTSYSKIDPTKSHLNYNLCEGDLVELLEEKKKTAYIRSEKTDIAFVDIVVPYPKDCSVSAEDYFKAIYDIFTHERTLKYCIGAYVHMDESNPHMHYICMPIEKSKEFTKSKDVKVFDEEKGKEVNRRIKTKYTERFNAKKLFNKILFNNLHPFVQKKINDRGIEGTVITPERVEFNKWKKEKLEQYNKLIEQEPEKKEFYINQFWEDYKRMNPKDYKKDRPKDQRLDDFNDMVKSYKMELKQEQEEVFIKLKEESKKAIADFALELEKKKRTSKAEIEKIDNQIKAKKEELERQKSRYTEQELYDLCYKQVGNEVYLTDFFEDLIKKEIVNSLTDNEGKPTELLKDLYRNFIRKEYNMQNLDSIIHKEEVQKYERLLKEYGINEQVIEQRLGR